MALPRYAPRAHLTESLQDVGVNSVSARARGTKAAAAGSPTKATPSGRAVNAAQRTSHGHPSYHRHPAAHLRRRRLGLLTLAPLSATPKRQGRGSCPAPHVCRWRQDCSLIENRSRNAAPLHENCDLSSHKDRVRPRQFRRIQHFRASFLWIFSERPGVSEIGTRLDPPFLASLALVLGTYYDERQQ
jgi:hypothetical protein